MFLFNLKNKNENQMKDSQEFKKNNSFLDDYSFKKNFQTFKKNAKIDNQSGSNFFDMPSHERKKFIVGILLFCVLISVILFVGINFFLLSYNKKLIKEKNQLYEQFLVKKEKLKGKKEQMDKARKFNSKLLIIDKMLDYHIHWTHFFDKLQKATLKKGVYYDNINANLSAINLRIIAIDFEHAAKQYYYLQNASDFIENIKLNKITSGVMENNFYKIPDTSATVVVYDVEIKPVPEIFLKK
jgi:hypothetical protein